jgi:hypothetical protein
MRYGVALLAQQNSYAQVGGGSLREAEMAEDSAIRDEIAAVAQEIWNVLDKGGALPVETLGQNVNSEPHIFEWALGWLAREDKIEITPQDSTFVVSKRDTIVKEAFI